ncbi:MAG: hypothetical protein ACRYFU_14010 [Janthinobacterium lividum]
MVNNSPDEAKQPSRLLPYFLQASDDGLLSNAVMLCEVIGEEIQSVSLRVAADAIGRWNGAQTAS